MYFRHVFQKLGENIHTPVLALLPQDGVELGDILQDQLQEILEYHIVHNRALLP